MEGYEVVTDDEQPKRSEPEAAAVGGVADERERLDDERAELDH